MNFEQEETEKTEGKIVEMLTGLSLLFLVCELVGCRGSDANLAKRPTELCRVNETIYDHGPQTYAMVYVYADSSYSREEFYRQHHLLSHGYVPGGIHNGQISHELLLSLEASIHSNSQWTNVNDIPTCYLEVDDSLTRYPEAVVELEKIARK